MIQINFQKPEKVVRSDDGSLMVHSVFRTIQGEGPNSGKRAIFLRLAGCNLQCPGCDTEYTDGAFRDSLSGIMARIRLAHAAYTAEPCLVVITGGEPFRQPIAYLCDLLGRNGYQVQIETNGTLGIPEEMGRTQWLTSNYPPQIVCSPKAGKVHADLFDYITAYKYVVNADDIDDEDGLPLSVLGMPARPARPHHGFEGTVYVQPADEPANTKFNSMLANESNMRAAINSVMRFGHTLCLQTHKIINLP